MTNKEGSFRLIGIVMALSFAVAIFWNQFSWIKGSVHAILDPTAGVLLDWNTTVGMIIILIVITLITTLVQKYATDQTALKELRKEQKLLQQEMKKYRDHPEKMLELNKKSMEFFPKTMKLNSRAMAVTIIPLAIFFRWFSDYFLLIPDFRFLGFMTWFWFYLVFSLILSAILRKYLDVV